MMSTYYNKPSILALSSPATRYAVAGGMALVLAGIAGVTYRNFGVPYTLDAAVGLLALCTVSLAGAAALAVFMPASLRIQRAVELAIADPKNGNPVHFKDGERLPRVACMPSGKGQYKIRLRTKSCPIERLSDLEGVISSAMTGRFKDYAVTRVIIDEAQSYADYYVSDVKADRSYTFQACESLKPFTPRHLDVQRDTTIDLHYCGSILVAGKTRSGKTTGIISLLLQVLLQGRDKYGSEVVIIDPKQAELSRLPHVVTLDADGGARKILDAVRHFADSCATRQKVLNDLSVERGDAVKWWEADFHPSFLFIDEYVALRTLFPKKGTKEDEGYTLAEFDALIKRIVTMGASAGCFAIISTAEASVEEGGLPSMLRAAMGTRILFRPTMAEARLLWPAEKLEAMNANREYGPGDAWFSSMDGVHEAVSFVHFPRLEFPVYAELGRLLGDYYAETDSD